MDSGLFEQEFYRISSLPPYVFAAVNAMKAKARAEGRDIIDLGMGNPDSPTPKHVIDKLIETVQDPTTHGYSMSKGIPGLRKALAGYYQRRFDVSIDPEKEAIVTLGSKEAFSSLATAISRPDGVVLVPDPCYPIHFYGFVIAGAKVEHYPCLPTGDVLQNIQKTVENSPQKPIAVTVSYPSNPTSEVVDVSFYEALVDYCRHAGVYIISDLAYCDIYFDMEPPPSILQVKGAKDIAIELTSMSKTYSMAGWRIGFGVGSEKLVGAMTKIKSYLDYGAFTPIQVAATAALNGPQDCVEENRLLYRERRDIIVKGLNDLGWTVPSPKASMFVWAQIPEPYASLGSLEFSKMLLEGANVAVSPGIGFGPGGDKYVRIALVENKYRLRQAVRNIRAFFQKERFASTGS